MFPALGSNAERRNGGVPQEGNLTKHLDIYRQHVDELVPDVDNSGLIIIDFESWRPIFRQNFGVLQPYKNVSYQIEQDRHPFWSKNRRAAEVRTLRFENDTSYKGVEEEIYFVTLPFSIIIARLRTDLKVLAGNMSRKRLSSRGTYDRRLNGDTMRFPIASTKA